MQLFRSEEDVAAWASGRERSVGATFSVHTLWRLASLWYDDRLRSPWRRKALAERQRILAAVGLMGDFWDLG